jgi:hypothetical protein
VRFDPGDQALERPVAEDLDRCRQLDQEPLSAGHDGS